MIVRHTSYPLLALFTAGYVARFVPPEYAWWLQILGILLPFMGLALVVMATLLALRRRWRLLAACALALVLLALRYAPSGFGGGGEGETLKVVTYNSAGGIHNLAGGDRGLPDLVESEAPDVLCLQEFTAVPHSEPPFGRPHTPFASYFESLGYLLVAPMRPGERDMRQPVATRTGVHRAENLGAETERMHAMVNGAIRAELEGRGGGFAVYNIHLLSYSIGWPGEEGDVRSVRTWYLYAGRLRRAILQRAVEARELRARLEAEELPFVVCGDLNTSVNQWAYREIARGLTDAGRAAGATFPARRPLFRIDYVLASPGWRVVSARVGPRLVSDHRPVVVELVR